MHDITITSATFEGATIPAVSARDLHAFLGVKRDFTSWIKGRIKQYGFVEGVDYLLTKTGEQLPSGTKYLSEYTITVSMGKELSMVERKEALKDLREEKALLEDITQLRLMLGQ